jgi:hypothetical protein
MQFLSPRATKESDFTHRLSGSRGAWYTVLRFCVSADAKIESVSIDAVAAENARQFDEVLRFIDDISDGMRSSLKHEAIRSGKRLCCARIEVKDIRFQPTANTDRMVLLGYAFARELLEPSSSSPIPPLHKDWLTSDVIALAHGIHANSALDGLPALYDALLEAGCDDPLVMEHCKRARITRRVVGSLK